MSSNLISRKLVERTVGGKHLSIETGHLAKQASGSVVVRIGDTMTLVALVAAPVGKGSIFSHCRWITARRLIPRVSSPGGSSSVKAGPQPRKSSLRD